MSVANPIMVLYVVEDRTDDDIQYIFTVYKEALAKLRECVKVCEDRHAIADPHGEGEEACTGEIRLFAIEEGNEFYAHRAELLNGTEVDA